MAGKKVKNDSKVEKLAKQILEYKGIEYDEWLNEQFQNLIKENTELLISSLATAKQLNE